ncbi:MAG: TIGR00282 family metallophosphoesterase [Clostridia bacterium]|nr:TIGR00282 family metallophosphoesterase [Clostridia bacterium]
MRVLAIGDVVSSAGCNYLQKALPRLKRQLAVDFCIANGENSAAGNGITPQSARAVFDSGVDVITTGNHVFRRRECYDLLDSRTDLLRPVNFHTSCPGRGFTVADLGYTSVGVVNLLGSAYMDRGSNPFDAMDAVLAQLKDCRVILVDFHAEATAEKKAMGYYLDGKVSALFGTHTHVMTADAGVLPGGTGYITDLGMTGPKRSVLGIQPELSVAWLKTGMPTRFEAADGPCMLNGCLFEIDPKSGRALSAESVQMEEP